MKSATKARQSRWLEVKQRRLPMGGLAARHRTAASHAATLLALPQHHGPRNPGSRYRTSRSVPDLVVNRGLTLPIIGQKSCAQTISRIPCANPTFTMRKANRPEHYSVLNQAAAVKFA
jgi:hypothetical protein